MAKRGEKVKGSNENPRRFEDKIYPKGQMKSLRTPESRTLELQKKNEGHRKGKSGNE